MHLFHTESSIPPPKFIILTKPSPATRLLQQNLPLASQINEYAISNGVLLSPPNATILQCVHKLWSDYLNLVIFGDFL